MLRKSTKYNNASSHVQNNELNSSQNNSKYYKNVVVLALTLPMKCPWKIIL